MPRRPRDTAPGFHHAWVNATGGGDYHTDDGDRMMWVRLLLSVSERYGWRCIAFVEMTTHVHLIVEVADRSLPRGMQRLNAAYSRHFNDVHGRAGQFVRGRYGSRRIRSAGDLLSTYAYVVLNPVEGGIRRRPELWRWSSYATTLGLRADFPFVDASVVVAEAGGVAALREQVDEELRRRLSRRATSGL